MNRVQIGGLLVVVGILGAAFYGERALVEEHHNMPEFNPDSVRVIEARRHPNDLDVERFVVEAKNADEFALFYHKTNPELYVRNCAIVPAELGHRGVYTVLVPVAAPDAECYTVS